MVIVVSCVEDKPPYRAHPNKLVGKNCTNGVCKVEVNESGDMTTSFPSLGVRCVKRDGILESLTQRQNMKIDPFKQGFQVKTGTFNLNAIRLCFQPFIMGPSGSQPIPGFLYCLSKKSRSYFEMQCYCFPQQFTEKMQDRKSNLA